MLRTPTYITWQNMKQRCLDPNAANYYKYGGAGVTICTEWMMSFTDFLADMGERPAGTTIDRIDGTKGYSPDNCRWATRSEQNLNRRKQTVKTHCGRGHEFTIENTLIRKDGYRQCRACARLGMERYLAQKVGV